MEDVGHGFGEGGEGHGFGYVLDNFELLALLKVGGIVGRGHDDDGKIAKIVVAAETAQEFEAVQRGELEVQEEGDKFLGGRFTGAGKKIEGLASVGDKFDMDINTGSAELAQKEFAIIIVIFDDKNANRVGSDAHEMKGGVIWESLG
jgi:hypothetical protein